MTAPVIIARVVAALALLALVLALASPAAAETYPLNAGEPAPVEGLLLDEEATKRVVVDVETARRAEAVIETMRAERDARDRELAELRQQIAELQAEALKRAIAVAVAEDREKRRQEDDARIARVLERSEAALERAGKRIEQLERRAFWQSILGPLAFAAGIFVGGFGF